MKTATFPLAGILGAIAVATALAQAPAPLRTEGPKSIVAKPAPMELSADAKTVTFHKEAIAERACFEGGDCLSVDELRQLVAGRQARASAAAQATQTIDAFKQAFVGSETKLGECEEAIAPLRKLRAAIVSGDLVDWPAVKAAIETANPGKRFDVATRVVK